MQIDSVKIIEALDRIIKYNWDSEMKAFMEAHEVEISSQDNLEEWITLCEKNKWTDDIFYHLLIVKCAFED